MSVVALGGIKTQIKTVLDGANTTTGSPIDLSNGMTTRVQKILTYSTAIPVQPSFYPAIAISTVDKDVEPMTIAKDQLTGQRKGMLNFSIAGFVWLDAQTSGFELSDIADNECEKLMENVEQVLRSDPTLGGNVAWSHPTKVTYHNVLEEGAHFRVAIMNLQARVHY